MCESVVSARISITQCYSRSRTREVVVMSSARNLPRLHEETKEELEVDAFALLLASPNVACGGSVGAINDAIGALVRGAGAGRTITATVGFGVASSVGLGDIVGLRVGRGVVGAVVGLKDGMPVGAGVGEIVGGEVVGDTVGAVVVVMSTGGRVIGESDGGEEGISFGLVGVTVGNMVGASVGGRTGGAEGLAVKMTGAAVGGVATSGSQQPKKSPKSVGQQFPSKPAQLSCA